MRRETTIEKSQKIDFPYSLSSLASSGQEFEMTTSFLTPDSYPLKSLRDLFLALPQPLDVEKGILFGLIQRFMGYILKSYGFITL